MAEEGIIVKDKKPKAKVEDKVYPDLKDYERIDICRMCPIYMHEIGVCNPKKWLDPKTMKATDYAAKGSIRGCGCRVESKAKKPSSHCNAGLW